jgi:hypothetical protein
MSDTTHQAHAEEMGAGSSSGIGATTARQHSAQAHSIGEGPLARAIEEQTARLPSDIWLWAAGGSIALSLFLQASNDKPRSLFIGQWAPTFLLLGIYNKMVKQNGSN